MKYCLSLLLALLLFGSAPARGPGYDVLHAKLTSPTQTCYVIEREVTIQRPGELLPFPVGHVQTRSCTSWAEAERQADIAMDQVRGEACQRYAWSCAP